MAAPYGKRQVTLRGTPIINEEGAAGVAIKPGYLVDGVSTIVPHATAAGNCPRTFALERDEMGVGIDSTYTQANTGVGSPDYAIGDTVKVGAFHPGCQVVAWLASGQTITENQRLESAGNGTLRAIAAGVILARAMEAVTATALTKIRVEVM